MRHEDVSTVLGPQDSGTSVQRQRNGPIGRSEIVAVLNDQGAVADVIVAVQEIGCALIAQRYQTL